MISRKVGVQATLIHALGKDALVFYRKGELENTYIIRASGIRFAASLKMLNLLKYTKLFGQSWTYVSNQFCSALFY